MNPKSILEKVCRSIDILINASQKYEGLFPSVLSLNNYEMPDELPPPIPGQRAGDRSYPGSNLIHDEALLMTMYAISKALNRKDYAEAADLYLKRFATHCTNTVTGLFPWGEHAFWHLKEDRVAGNIHDHLRQAPLWLWEKLYEYNPRCVERFAEGLDYHWKDGEPLEYTRHAPINEMKRPGRNGRACDFPRHSGFYIFDISFAYTKTRRSDFLQQINRLVDYWWEKRDKKGLLLTESRSPENNQSFYNVNAPGQTISLAASLLESALLLDKEERELASQMRHCAQIYTNGFLSAPHNLEAVEFVLGCKRDNNEVIHFSPVWGSIYGVWPSSYVALMALCIYRMESNEKLLRSVESIANCYIEKAFPDDVAVPAMDSGLMLGLLAELYDITDDKIWLKAGLDMTDKLIEIYLDGELPRGASGIAWYESQMGPSFLLHGLTRIALLSIEKNNCPLPADYTAR